MTDTGVLHLWRSTVNPPCTDPLARLMDPAFKDVLWFYEKSRTEPDIPGSLHPKQVEQLHASAHYRHRWLFWGNQVGKTAFGAIDLALLCLGRHPVQKWQPPVRCWASALTWDLWEKILLPELLTWLPPDRVIDAPTPRVQSTKRDIRILADNGTESLITGKAAQQGADQYQSARIHRVWLDEEHPEAVYDEMQPRLLRFGGDTLATMTPLKGMTWVHSRIYEPWSQKREEAKRHFCTHAGLADNPSMKQEQIEELTIELRNNPSMLKARLFGLFVRPVGAVWPFDADSMLDDMGGTDADPAKFTAEQIEWIKMRIREGWQLFAGLDLGKWRWALSLYLAAPEAAGGTVYLIDEIFSQNEDVDTRAGKLKALYEKYDAPDYVGTRADCADPNAVIELNNALERCKSKWSVAAVEMKHKIIAAGVDRVESLMRRGLFKVRRGIGQGQTWFLGMQAGKPGKPVEGSRWKWEVDNWQYPKVLEHGILVRIQKDEPDDTTADGADMMDSTRYAIMTWYTPDVDEKPKGGLTVYERLRQEFEQLDEAAQPAPDYGRPLRQ
jgi:phage terminase large subunit-like protein